MYQALISGFQLRARAQILNNPPEESTLWLPPVMGAACRLS